MNTKLLNEADGQRTYAAIFETGDEAAGLLTRFAREQYLQASVLSAVGGFSEATLGYFDVDTKRYLQIPVREQVEVLSFLGDITLDGDGPKVHAHVVLGRRDGSTVGGHLLEGTVRPTLEVIVVEQPSYLRRTHDDATGLALIDPLATPARA